jgi:iron complex outermembrane receptor protein
MIRTKRACATLIAGVALSAPAWAQTDVDPYELSPEQLFDATVVAASRTPENVWDTAAAVYVITAEDIQRSGATNIAEALRLAPGVDVARINTSGWAVSVRGFNSALANKLLVLVDGRETYDPLFSGVYWDVQDTALEDIDRIEIIRGPGASLWGANAVNGVINIVTKAASETQGSLVSIVAGDTERGSVTARYGGAWGDRGHWRIYGRAFDRDDQELLSGADDNSSWQALRGGFRADLSLDARNALTLQGDIYHSETGQYRSAFSFAAPFQALEAESIVAEGGNVLGRWTREFEDGARLTTQAYVDVTRRSQRTLEDRRTTFDLDVQHEFPTIGAHDVVGGVRYRFTRDEVTQTDMIRSPSNVHEEQLFSGFVQDQVQLSPSWRLTVGSKFDDNDYTGLEIQPNARLQWSSDNQTAWASLSRAVRSPSELDREFQILLAAGPPFPLDTRPVTIELLPSPDFESEEVIAYELGYRRRWGDTVEMDVTAFFNDYDELSTLTPLAPQLGADPPRIILIPIVLTNGTTAEASGIEAVLNWRPHHTVDVSVAYSYLDLELDAPPGAIDGEVAEGRSPQHQASVRLKWDVTDNLSIDSVLYYVAELPDYQIDSYTRADLRLGYRLSEHVMLELVGQNLLDDSHREFGAVGDANAAEIQRSVFGRITWRR